MAEQLAVPVMADLFRAGEYSGRYWATLKFKCPRCHRRHNVSVDSEGQIPKSITAQYSQKLGPVDVAPWRHETTEAGTL
jgi:hypothetical protein